MVRGETEYFMKAVGYYRRHSSDCMKDKWTHELTSLINKLIHVINYMYLMILNTYS